MKKYVYDKTVEKLRNRIDVRLLINTKDYLKQTSKLRYKKQNTFDNDLVVVKVKLH